MLFSAYCHWNYDSNETTYSPFEISDVIRDTLIYYQRQSNKSEILSHILSLAWADGKNMIVPAKNICYLHADNLRCSQTTNPIFGSRWIYASVICLQENKCSSESYRCWCQGAIVQRSISRKALFSIRSQIKYSIKQIL